MHIVSWNMGCAPIRSRYRKSHTEARDYLLRELDPDVCFIQEALTSPGIWEPHHPGLISWSTDQSSDSGTAILVREGLEAEPFSIRCDGSYLAGATISLSGQECVLVSIHVGPPNYRKHLRRLVDALDPIIEGKTFVIGGDLNAARHVDEVYGGKWFTTFFDDLAAKGYHDCHWSIHEREIQSFWGHQAKNAYQCDHLFVDRELARHVADCRVIDNDTVRRLSDHGPLGLVLDEAP